MDRGRRLSPVLTRGVSCAEARQDLHLAPSKPALPRCPRVRGEGMSPPGRSCRVGWTSRGEDMDPHRRSGQGAVGRTEILGTQFGCSPLVRRALAADHWKGLTGSAGDPPCWMALTRQLSCSAKWGNWFDGKALLCNRGVCTSDRLSWTILIIELIPILYWFISILKADIKFQSRDMHSLPPQTLSPLTGRGRQNRAVPTGGGPSFADDFRSVITPELPLSLAHERTGLYFPPTSS